MSLPTEPTRRDYYPPKRPRSRTREAAGIALELLKLLIRRPDR